jgi:hypothetical protein
MVLALEHFCESTADMCPSGSREESARGEETDETQFVVEGVDRLAVNGIVTGASVPVRTDAGFNEEFQSRDIALSRRVRPDVLRLPSPLLDQSAGGRSKAKWPNIGSSDLA